MMTMDEWSASLLSILACSALFPLSTAQTYTTAINPVNPQQPAITDDHEETTGGMVPYISSMFPTYGPIAGGTPITITGGLFGSANSTVTITLKSKGLRDVMCPIFALNSTVIKCTTEPAAEELIDQPLILQLWDSSSFINATEPFTFKPDPQLTKVYPNTAIVEGGVFLNVLGNNLESVARPLMRVKVSYNNTSQWTNYTGCEVRNNTWMRCKTPNLSYYLPKRYNDSLANRRTQINRSRPKRYADAAAGLLQRRVQLLSSNNIARIKRSTDQEITINDDDLRFTLGFKLDGVPSFEDLETIMPKFAKIDVVVNPTIEKFSPFLREFKPDWPDHHNFMDIKGENLDVGARIEDYVVKVGNEVCLVTRLLTQGLFFEPPSSQPDAVNNDGSVRVTLYVGNVKHNVGSLKYYAWWESTLFIIFITIAVIVFLVVVVVLVFCVRRYRKACIYHSRFLTRTQSNGGHIYVGVPIPRKTLLERIDPKLRKQIKESLLKDPDNLQIGKEIGKGMFGKVYDGHLVGPTKKAKTLVAIKTVKGDSDIDSVETFLKEAILMKPFNHPNVLTLLGIAIKKDIPYVILPFMDHGDLKTYISDENNRFIARDLVSFSLDIAKGMSYLEQHHFVHRDLAARNCMVDKENNIKVGDFGMARDIYVADYYRMAGKAPLPLRWMAIESIESQKYTTKSDVWSFGVVLWELMSRGGCIPYPGIDNLDIAKHLKRGYRLLKPMHTTTEVYAIMTKCWETQPDDRPTFKQVVPMLEQCLKDKKITAEQAPPPPNVRKMPEAKPDNEFANMKQDSAAPSPAHSYLQLVDMPDTSALAEHYLPMN